MQGDHEPWMKPYQTLEDVQRDIARGVLEMTRMTGAAGNEPCESCGAPVHYKKDEIAGHLGWWEYIGKHQLGDAYIPHTVEQCKMRRDDRWGD